MKSMSMHWYVIHSAVGRMSSKIALLLLMQKWASSVTRFLATTCPLSGFFLYFRVARMPITQNPSKELLKRFQRITNSTFVPKSNRRGTFSGGELFFSNYAKITVSIWRFLA